MKKLLLYFKDLRTKLNLLMEGKNSTLNDVNNGIENKAYKVQTYMQWRRKTLWFWKGIGRVINLYYDKIIEKTYPCKSTEKDMKNFKVSNKTKLEMT